MPRDGGAQLGAEHGDWCSDYCLVVTVLLCVGQGGFDGRGQPTASPMLTAIMSGGVGISGRELYKYR